MELLLMRRSALSGRDDNITHKDLKVKKKRTLWCFRDKRLTQQIAHYPEYEIAPLCVVRFDITSSSVRITFSFNQRKLSSNRQQKGDGY